MALVPSISRPRVTPLAAAGVTLVALLLAAPTPLLPTPWGQALLAAQRTAAEPDARALDAARKLISSGVPLEDVASQLRGTYRQSAAQTSAVFVALRTAPGSAAPALMRSYRLGGQAATAALLDGGYTPAAAVQGMSKAGVPVGEVAQGLLSRGTRTRSAAALFKEAGIGVAEAVAGFRFAGVGGTEAATAAMVTYGGLPRDLSAPLQAAGYPANIVFLAYKELGHTAVEFAVEALAGEMSWQGAAGFLGGRVRPRRPGSGAGARDSPVHPRAAAH